MLYVGVLALQGGVEEHMRTLAEAARKAKMHISLRSVRTNEELEGLDALAIPGGESTALSILMEKEGMLEKVRAVPALFGTCAGLILMAKEVDGAAGGQKFLSVMDVKVSRNAYGAQPHSFEAKINAGSIGEIKAIFIRAPKIISCGAGVDTLSSIDGEPVLVEQKMPGRYFLGATFHPELTTAKVHEYFLKEAAKLKE